MALLERVELNFTSGLNVVSGETGEGKSLLMLAINLLLGARARKGLVRAGRDYALVEGRFVLDDESRALVRASCDLVEERADEICLGRRISVDGSSRAYLNGSMIPVGLLAKVGAGLVDVHGQSEHLSLRQPREQARVLDRFGSAASV